MCAGNIREKNKWKVVFKKGDCNAHDYIFEPSNDMILQLSILYCSY